MKYQSLIQIVNITDQDCTQKVRKLHPMLEKMAIEEIESSTNNSNIQNTVILNQPLQKDCYNCAHNTPAFGANYCINYPKY